MKQYEAVIKVMENNGGYATLGFLNQEACKVKGCVWKTKTPFASIRRIVQDKRFFFKIRPGLWALKEWGNKLPPSLQSKQKISESKQLEFSHTYYQGLLVEIGNLKQYNTFIPAQDKNRVYLGRKLGDIATVKIIYQFGYENILQKAKSVDVSWFNIRKMPLALYEVEHTTDIQNSLLKFVELQDFNTQMYIVADIMRQKEFHTKLYLSAFQSIQKRVQFLSYEHLSNWHSKTYEIISVEKNISSL